jgi:aryl-alcohol dehydrogenase-like predicted oxidoreductase
MKYAPLGKTEMKVSKITFGCWEMGGAQWKITDDENNVNAVRKALELGFTSFDTAEAYGNGHSEEVLGKALEGHRKEVVLATKVTAAHLHAGDIRASVTNSLKRLRTDYLDIYYMHWPNFEIPLEETMGELAKLKKEGLIRAIGASNFGVETLKKASAIARIDAIQPEYSLLHRGIEEAVIPWCLENSVSIMSYSSIAKGILTGIFHLREEKFLDDDFRLQRRLFTRDHLEKERPLINAMKEMAKAKGLQISQIAIAWLLQKKALTSAIVGTQSEKHILENIQAVDIVLTPEEEAKLDKISAEVLHSIEGSLGMVIENPALSRADAIK